MTQERIDLANKLQNEIYAYEKVIRYAAVNGLCFTGMIGSADLHDKELCKLVYDHCKKKQAELQKEYDEL